MNKKLSGLLVAFILLISQAVCVFAAPSIQIPGSGQPGYGDNFTDVVKDETALKVIDYINNTDASNAESIEVINDLTPLSLDGGILATDFYKVPNYEKDANGMYVFTVEVPNLPDNVNKDAIRGIVFYNAQKKWDVITPIKLENKTLTFMTPYIPSAIAIYFPTTLTTTSPVTGIVGNYGLLMSTVVIASVVSGLAYKKSEEN